MAKFNMPRGLTAFLFTVVSLLVIAVAYLSSVAHPPPVLVSKVSTRHFPNEKVAVPFGSNEGLLFAPAQVLNNSFPELGKSAPGHKVRRQTDQRISWADALAAGAESLKLLLGLRDPRDQSVVNNLDQIRDAGWSISSTTDTITDEYDQPGGPFATLGIVADDGHSIAVRQDQRFDNCLHQDNAPTGGVFINIYNVPGRAIIGDFNFGCAFQLTKQEKRNPAAAEGLPPVKERVPNVWKWSDIVWNVWASEAGDRAPSLLYIFKHHIITASTMGIMDNAVDVPYDTLDIPWPGITYQPNSRQYRALLGTPHGKGVVFMLVDRPYGLKNKNIQSITMFTTEGDDVYYNLLFTVTP